MTIFILGILLLSTNGWWLYRSIDFGITYTHQQQTLIDNQMALDQLRGILAAYRPALQQGALIDVAETVANETVVPKDGCVWIGRLGFMFDDDARLVHVSRAWNLGEPDPCFP